MNTHDRKLRHGMIMAFVLLLGACATSPEQPSEAERARAALDELQSDPALASRAPLAIREAELAVTAAEDAERGTELAAHLAFIADRKVDIARAQAETRLYVDRREALREERDRLRLMARTQEAEAARRDARLASLQAQATREEAAQLRREIDELNAKPTDQGLVLTLGDVLFETGEATIKAGAHNDLDSLADFLERYAERDVRIVGHTDSVGAAAFNEQLSERRAEAVKSYLVSEGIRANRITTTGRGETTPIASNDTAGGRQLNRRVEIVIENPSVAGR
ncbi:MAG TPA: OmpA family protein [Gammaproteobacteria bacterium]